MKIPQDDDCLERLTLLLDNAHGEVLLSLYHNIPAGVIPAVTKFVSRRMLRDGHHRRWCRRSECK